jgi:predicted TIM-barrel enzyme
MLWLKRLQTITGIIIMIKKFPDVKAASNLPVLVGSGVTTENVQNYLSASGLIIGSHFKRDGR